MLAARRTEEARATLCSTGDALGEAKLHRPAQKCEAQAGEIDEASPCWALIISRPDPGRPLEPKWLRSNSMPVNTSSRAAGRARSPANSLDLERLDMAIAAVLAGDVLLDGDRLFAVPLRGGRASRMRDPHPRRDQSAAAAEMRRMAAGTAPIYPCHFTSTSIPPLPAKDGDAQARTAWLYAFHCSGKCLPLWPLPTTAAAVPTATSSRRQAFSAADW